MRKEIESRYANGTPFAQKMISSIPLLSLTRDHLRPLFELVRVSLGLFLENLFNHGQSRKQLELVVP